MEEIWKDIEGFENRYQISNTGKVRFVRTKKLLNPWVEKGYERVGLSTGNKKHKYFTVHKLVANHFIKKIFNKAYINHIDGNKLNNFVYNLEWCTPAENVAHSIHNLQKNRWNKWVFNTQTGIYYHTIKEASFALGRKNIAPAYLGAMLNGYWKNRTPIILAA